MSELRIRDVHVGGDPPTVPPACPTCGATPPAWRFQQVVSVAQGSVNGPPLHGVFWTCARCNDRRFYGSGGTS